MYEEYRIFKHPWYYKWNILKKMCKSNSKVIEEEKNYMRWPRICDGETAWKAAVLTTIPPSPLNYYTIELIIRKTEA